MTTHGEADGNREQVMDDKGDKKAKEKALQVPFFKLFSYADFWDYVLMTVGSLGAIAHGASVPVFFVFFGKLIDVMGIGMFFPASVSDKVTKYALDFVYLGIAVLFSSWAEVMCWMHTGERQAAKIRGAYLNSMLNQDISLFDTEASTGEVISAITSDIIIVQDAISEKVGNFLHYISRFLAGFAIGFAHVWQISLVTLSIVPLIAFAGGVYAFVAISLSSRARNSYLRAGQIAEEVIGNVRTVQAFVGEEKAVGSYKEALLETYEHGKRGGLAKGLGLGSMLMVLFLSWALLVWYTSIVVHNHIANGGDAFTTMLNVVISGISLGQAAPDITAFAKAKTAAYPIFKMIKRSVGKEIKGGSKKLEKVDGHIQLQNICFSYPARPDIAILKMLNFDIPSGKIVALVGGSGSGKSTIISLIERFYEPSSGSIILDGHDIKHLDLRWLRQQIGLVSQEPALFATSIRENLLYGKEDATAEEIMEALKLAEALSFVNNLPGGLDTQVGERGIQISGGQKQRIAIARAILKNPSILLLDEATSALDAESEKSVQAALDRVMIGRTTVVVAHRLSTIKSANVIAVVQNGRIVESGTHEELMSGSESAYSALVKLQESSHGSLTKSGSIKEQSKLFSRDIAQRTGSFGRSFRSENGSIHFSMNNDETQVKHQPVPLKRLFVMASPDWVYGMWGMIGSCLSGVLFPLFALGVSHALVAYYSDWEVTKREIRKICLLFCGAAILTVVFNVLEHLCFGIMGERLTLRVREKMFGAILQNEIGWFDESSNASSMLASRLETDATLLRTIVVDRSALLVQNLALIVTSFAISFMLNWRITLVLLATYPLIVGGTISEKLFLQGFDGNLSKAYLHSNMLAVEAVSNIRTVAAFCSENKVLGLYMRQLATPASRSFWRGQVIGFFYGLSQCLEFCAYALALWYGSRLMHDGLASFKSVMKTFMVLIVTAVAVGDTLAMLPDLMKGNQMVESVFEILDREPESKVVGDGGKELVEVEGEIEMKRIRFSYPSRPEVVIFENFNLKVHAGKSMALVGASGSGKSSVLALMLRFYDPLSGKVMIDGVDIRKMQLKSLRRHIGLVQQEPALFATTIYENILYGNDSATESEVIHAARLANADSFISNLPDGYSTKVGERGVQLSGGQKQRVAIARALLKKPAILLLDEATSALDAESEHVVQQALDRLMKDRTTVIVAHRLSTIQNADVISVLQDGKVIQQGNHSSLVENKEGAYYKLISLQHREEEQQC